MGDLDYISDVTFDERVAESEEMTLVDFTADWCAPCKAMEPTLERIAVDYAGRLRVVKVDLDESPALTERFNVLSIPMLILLQQGQPIRRIKGAQSHAALVSEIEVALSR